MREMGMQQRNRLARAIATLGEALLEELGDRAHVPGDEAALRRRELPGPLLDVLEVGAHAPRLALPAVALSESFTILRSSSANLRSSCFTWTASSCSRKSAMSGA